MSELLHVPLLADMSPLAIATASSSSGPLMALGMVIAPGNAPKRQLVRETMLNTTHIRNSNVVFRFLIVCPTGDDCAAGRAIRRTSRRPM